MPRAPLPNEPPLLEAEHAIQLAERAAAFFHAPGEDYDVVRSRMAVGAAMDAALVALETAVDTGDPRVLAAALELATERTRWDDDPLEYEVGSAAAAILAAVTEITNRVRECARSKSASLRLAAARGLGARAARSLRGEGDDVDAEAAAIVLELTKDEDAYVRKIARESLGGAAPPAWAAIFPRDPLAPRSAADAARLRGPLDRAVEALEGGVRKDARPLADAIGELPDDLAAPILEAWIRTSYTMRAKGVGQLIDRWLALDPDGTRTVAWLREAERDGLDFQAGRILGPALSRRPGPHALAVSMEIARLVPGLEMRNPTAFTIAGEILAAAWPGDADPTPLLEIALGVPLAEAAATADDASRNIWASTLIQVALAPRPSRVALDEPLAEAFVAGCPGRWALLRFKAAELLVDVSHPGLRALAEARLRSGDRADIVWALRHLSRGGHDPDRDPPRRAMLRAWARDPRLRAAMLGNPDLRGAAHEVMRAELGTGELEPGEAIALAASLLAADATLAPAEWATVRAARTLLEEPTLALGALPRPVEWNEDDRAFVEAIAEARGTELLIAVTLASKLAQGETPELVSILERLLERAPQNVAAMIQGFMTHARTKERT